MNEHRWSTVGRGVVALIGALVMSIGFGVAADRAGAEVVPTNSDGCPANPDPSTAEPCVTFEVLCPKFGLNVRMANSEPAGKNAHFVITVDGTTNHEGGGEFTLTPNETRFTAVHIGENSTVSIKIEETETGYVFADGTFTRDCTDPSASVQPSCADGAVVSMQNPSELQTVDFQIDAYDGGAATPTRTFTVNDVGPDGATQVVPNAGDGNERIVVTAFTQEGPSGTPPTAEVVADESVVVDCEHPTPTAQVSFECGDTPTITITLNATDEQTDTTFHVVVQDGDGTAVLTRDVTISGVGTETVTDSALAEDETHTVTVTVGDETIASAQVHVDCEEVEPSSTTQTTAGPTTTSTTGPTQVLGTQVRAAQLPRTGSGAGPQLLVGLGLLLAGAGLVGFGAIPFMPGRRPSRSGG